MRYSNDKLMACWLFCLFAFLYLLSGSGHFYASDTVQKLAVLTSYFEHGTLAVSQGWVKGFHSLSYSWFPLGSSLIMLPGYVLGHLLTTRFPFVPGDYLVRLCISLENAFFSAALVTVVYRYARFLGHGRGAGLFSALALGLGTMIWPYAKSDWSEPAATLCAFGGVFALHKALEASKDGRVPLLLASGTLLALAAFTRTELFLVAFGALAFFLWRAPERSMRYVACFTGPLVIVLLLGFGYDWLRYGALFTFPNYNLPQSQFSPKDRLGRSLRNLYRYTLSPNQGLIWFSPAALAGLLGLRRFWRRLPTASQLFLFALLPLALFYVLAWGSSSWAWGLRYEYIFLPFALLPAATLWEQASKRARSGLVLLVMLGAGVQMLGIISNFDVIYQREIRTHPGLTIHGIMNEPAHGPLLLAAKSLPELLRKGPRAWAENAMPLDVKMARVKRRHLPDNWLFLPLPLSLKRIVLIAELAGLLISLGGLFRVARGRGQAKESLLEAVS